MKLKLLGALALVAALAACSDDKAANTGSASGLGATSAPTGAAAPGSEADLVAHVGVGRRAPEELEHSARGIAHERCGLRADLFGRPLHEEHRNMAKIAELRRAEFLFLEAKIVGPNGPGQNQKRRTDHP